MINVAQLFVLIVLQKILFHVLLNCCFCVSSVAARQSGPASKQASNGNTNQQPILLSQAPSLCAQTKILFWMAMHSIICISPSTHTKPAKELDRQISTLALRLFVGSTMKCEWRANSESKSKTTQYLESSQFLASSAYEQQLYFVSLSSSSSSSCYLHCTKTCLSIAKLAMLTV